MQTRELADWLATALGSAATLEGDPSVEIHGAAAVEEASAQQISFAAGRKAAQLAASSRAGCLLVSADFDNATLRTVIRVPEPRLAFAMILRRLHPQPTPLPGVHPTAVVDPDVKLGEGVSIGPHCTVGSGSEIGAGSVLHSSATVYPGSRIGARVTLHSGVVIGADGFGFVLMNGRYEKFPQIGRVVIGDDVEIGANSCIDRAALGVTEIGDGTKLDNMVHIGHNCRIGKHVVIAAQTGISGGVVVEDYAVIGGQVGIGDKARITARAVVGSGAGILTSKVVHAGEPVWGTPARPLKEHLAQLAHLARLPKLAKTVSELAQRVGKLEGK